MLKKFNEFITENSDDKAKNAKDSVMATIASNFQRFANSSKEGDVAALVMLTAAVAMLSASESSYAVQSAKRLAQMAIQRAGKS